MVLICHVILQDHMIKESMIFMNRDTWRNVTILSSLEAMVIVVVVIYNGFNFLRGLARVRDQSVMWLYG